MNHVTYTRLIAAKEKAQETASPDYVSKDKSKK